MAGTKEGARKMWEARRARGDNNPEYFRELAAKRKKAVGGFGANPELARKVVQARWAKERAEVEADEQVKRKSPFDKVINLLRNI